MMYSKGDIFEVFDEIDPSISEICTAVFIEQDIEMPDLNWIYLAANEECLNDKLDIKFPIPYFKIMEANSPYLKLISKATTN